jgi:hypothetical protein
MLYMAESIAITNYTSVYGYMVGACQKNIAIGGKAPNISLGSRLK